MSKMKEGASSLRRLLCAKGPRKNRGPLPSKITHSIRDAKAKAGQAVTWWKTDTAEERNCGAEVPRAVQESAEERTGRSGKLQEREASPWTSKTEEDLCK